MEKVDGTKIPELKAIFNSHLHYLQVLLVSSSRYPDQWIVPGGGMEPEEEPGGAAVREVYEEVTKIPTTSLQNG